MPTIKILLLDVETAPNLAYVWRLWDENVPLERLIDSGYILSWAAKWYGEDVVYFDSVEKKKHKAMLKTLHKLLDEADAVVHYNGVKFDIPHINRAFLENGYLPPSPYKQIDLLQTVKSKFKFPSNKLDYVVKALGLGQKVKHMGFELWTRCIKKDPEAWAIMSSYNVNDVVIMEKLYTKLLPWIKGHANHSLFSEDAMVCPNCGGSHLHKRGFAHTLSSTYRRFRCQDCGTWCRDNKNLVLKKFKTVEVS